MNPPDLSVQFDLLNIFNSSAHLYVDRTSYHIYKSCEYQESSMSVALKCVVKQCRSKGHFSNYGFNLEESHNHNADLREINKAKFNYRLKKRITTESLPMEQIFEEELERFEDNPPDVKFSSFRLVLSQLRKKMDDACILEELVGPQVEPKPINWAQPKIEPDKLIVSASSVMQIRIKDEENCGEIEDTAISWLPDYYHMIKRETDYVEGYVHKKEQLKSLLNLHTINTLAIFSKCNTKINNFHPKCQFRRKLKGLPNSSYMNFTRKMEVLSCPRCRRVWAKKVKLQRKQVELGESTSRNHETFSHHAHFIIINEIAVYLDYKTLKKSSRKLNAQRKKLVDAVAQNEKVRQAIIYRVVLPLVNAHKLHDIDPAAFYKKYFSQKIGSRAKSLIAQGVCEKELLRGMLISYIDNELLPEINMKFLQGLNMNIIYPTNSQTVSYIQNYIKKNKKFHSFIDPSGIRELKDIYLKKVQNNARLQMPWMPPYFVVVNLTDKEVSGWVRECEELEELKDIWERKSVCSFQQTESLFYDKTSKNKLIHLSMKNIPLNKHPFFIENVMSFVCVPAVSTYIEKSECPAKISVHKLIIYNEYSLPDSKGKIMKDMNARMKGSMNIIERSWFYVKMPLVSSHTCHQIYKIDVNASTGHHQDIYYNQELHSISDFDLVSNSCIVSENLDYSFFNEETGLYEEQNDSKMNDSQSDDGDGSDEEFNSQIVDVSESLHTNPSEYTSSGVVSVSLKEVLSESTQEKKPSNISYKKDGKCNGHKIVQKINYEEIHDLPINFFSTIRLPSPSAKFKSSNFRMPKYKPDAKCYPPLNIRAQSSRGQLQNMSIADISENNEDTVVVNLFRSESFENYPDVPNNMFANSSAEFNIDSNELPNVYFENEETKSVNHFENYSRKNIGSIRRLLDDLEASFPAAANEELVNVLFNIHSRLNNFCIKHQPCLVKVEPKTDENATLKTICKVEDGYPYEVIIEEKDVEPVTKKRQLNDKKKPNKRLKNDSYFEDPVLTEDNFVVLDTGEETVISTDAKFGQSNFA